MTQYPTSVSLVTSLTGAMIQCNKCGRKWFDNYYIINGKTYCMDCGDPIAYEIMIDEEKVVYGDIDG